MMLFTGQDVWYEALIHYEVATIDVNVEFFLCITAYVFPKEIIRFLKNSNVPFTEKSRLQLKYLEMS